MATVNRTKINKLVSSWPRGAVFTALFLRKKGFSDDLIQHYKKSGWIKPISRGAYKLSNDEVEWFGGVYALQKQLMLDIHPGGKTALFLQGYAHYASDKLPWCHLYGRSGLKQPHWFSTYDWGVNIIFVATKLFPANLDNSFVEYKFRDFHIKISAPERAVFEMLYHVPSKQGFEETVHIMDGLTTLRPGLVQRLLEKCRSIKVKRLFLYLAEKTAHSWTGSLDVSRINLGKGDRLIAERGVLDKKYRITVPRGL